MPRLTLVLLALVAISGTTARADLITGPTDVGPSTLNNGNASVVSLGDMVHYIVGAGETEIYFQFEVNENNSNGPSLDLAIDFFKDIDASMSNNSVAEDDAVAYAGGNDFADANFNSSGSNQTTYEWVISGVTAGDVICATVITFADDSNGPELMRFSGSSLQAVPEPGSIVLVSLGACLAIHRRRRR